MSLASQGDRAAQLSALLAAAEQALREIAERCESEDYSSEEQAEFAAIRARAALAGRGDRFDWQARAEAAEQALHEIAAADGSNDPTWWGSSPEHLRSIARAALAGREESHDCRCDGNPSGGSCAYPDCKLPPPTTEELLGLAGREETGGG